MTVSPTMKWPSTCRDALKPDRAPRGRSRGPPPETGRAAARAAGLVTARSDAERRLYRLRPDPLRAIDEWLEPYRQLWAASLDALERHLDSMPDGGGGSP